MAWLRTPSAQRAADFLAALHERDTVASAGFTHNHYRYPACFSPRFARAAITAFSRRGDAVLDPFMGGGTALIEASLLGRRSAGCDISSLAHFISRVKTNPLPRADLTEIRNWLQDVVATLNIRDEASETSVWRDDGYQKHIPWRVRKIAELTLARLVELSSARQRRYARCLLLRMTQWAVERDRPPTLERIRLRLMELFAEAELGMIEYGEKLKAADTPGLRPICIRRRAADLDDSLIKRLGKRPKLVLTSPPYPGVYVLYHRWKVRGRKESAAPFWIADCEDGHGQAHYTLGNHKQASLDNYFDGIRDSFSAVREIISPTGLVVQMLAFSEPDWQLPRYHEAMAQAGFVRVSVQALGFEPGELWRKVPGRRWFARVQKGLATSQEVVLFYRPIKHRRVAEPTFRRAA